MPSDTSSPAAPAPSGAEPDLGFLGRLAGTLFSPTSAFGAIVRAPRFWAPLLALVALNVAFTGVWMAKVDAKEFMQARFDENAKLRDLPAENREAILEKQVAWLPVIAWVGAVLGAPILIGVVGIFLLFVFRFVYGSEATASQSLSITAWSFLTVGVVQAPLSLLTLLLKGDWTLEPQTAFQASAALFLDKSTVPHALFALAQSVDLLSFWLLALLAFGYAQAAKTRPSSALWGVLVPWLLVVLVKVGFAALNS